MKNSDNPNHVLITCLFMLFVGIIIYRNSLNNSKGPLDKSKLKGNFNSYFKNKGMVLIIFSSLFLLIYLIMFLLGKL